MPFGNAAPPGEVQHCTDEDEREALREMGVDPDDLRMQLRRAAVSYWLRRHAIAADIRPQHRPRPR